VVAAGTDGDALPRVSATFARPPVTPAPATSETTRRPEGILRLRRERDVETRTAR
jgi:hypothetical protein